MRFTILMSRRFSVFVFLSSIVIANDALSEISVVDDTGVSVVLSQPAKRLVVLGPNLIESLYEIGAGESILGASADSA
jgi:ABC-type Fe3+-hydroxamate transport system substrate-binding protein